jgi:hypothetical protein
MTVLKSLKSLGERVRDLLRDLPRPRTKAAYQAETVRRCLVALALITSADGTFTAAEKKVVEEFVRSHFRGVRVDGMTAEAFYTAQVRSLLAEQQFDLVYGQEVVKITNCLQELPSDVRCRLCHCVERVARQSENLDQAPELVHLQDALRDDQ